MTIYAGYDVLDQTEHNRLEARVDTYRRRFDLVDNRTGAREADDHAGFPQIARPVTWFCESRSAVNVMRAFVAARKGRAVPFWLPTWQQDAVLTTGILSGGSTITIEGIGYTRYVRPNATTRRHVRIAAHGLPMVYRKVSGSVDNGDGTETLSLDAVITPAYPVTGVVSFLALCRLEKDSVEWKWLGKTVAQAEFTAIDIGQETP